jgi:hypothetical protein
MNHTKPFKIISVILISIFILTVAFNSIPLSKFNNNQNYKERNSPFNPNLSITEVLSSPHNTTYLPNTNLSVREFIDGTPMNSYNTTVFSIDNANWYVHCDYTLPVELFSFDSTVNRTSLNGLYGATDYYGWTNVSQDYFDFWINTSAFQTGNEFENMTIETTETITMANLGSFNVWKLTGTDQFGYPITLRYENDTGMFVCLEYLPLGTIIWYNITQADFGKIQSGYDGPTLVSLSPSNDTIHPNGTIIDLEVTSPYDVHTLFYQWDAGGNLSIHDSRVQIPLPSDAGFHHLYVTAVDSLGYSSFFHFLYETNNDFPLIFLADNENNSRVQGLSQIIVAIFNGNGSFIYNWDESGNTTVIEGTPIVISNSEGVYILNIYAKSEKLLWLHKRFIFTVDNTPPIFIIDNPNNRSIIKGTVNIYVAVSERSNVTYKLNNEINDNFIAETELNYTITFLSLFNGSYQLNFTIFDEAKNPTNTIFFFDIYSSAFGWNWDLYANIPRTIDVIDASETTWFHLTLLSKTDQNFNLTVLPDELTPSKTEKMLFIIHFSYDRPSDIIFMTLNLPLDDTDQTNTFDVYQWVHWDNSNNQWQEITTSYNAISHSWEATYEGDIEFFALIKTGDTTELKSIEPGGGQIPAFTIFIVITGLITCSIFLRKKKSK